MNMKRAYVAGAMVVTGPAFGITVNFTDITFGSPAIGVAVSGNQTYKGQAGQFKGFLGGSASGSAVAVADAENMNIPAPFSTGGTSFTAYCAVPRTSASVSTTRTVSPSLSVGTTTLNEIMYLARFRGAYGTTFV